MIVKGQIIVNAYAKVNSISGKTLSIGAYSEVHHTFDVGDFVLIMQMQDNVIGGNTNDNASFGDLSNILSAGLYELAQIESVTRLLGVLTEITLLDNLSNSYNTGANSSLQVVTFRKLGSPNYSTVSEITALPWNGDFGGIVAFYVQGELSLNHNIDASGRGFRGGNFSATSLGGICSTTPFIASSNLGFKGEGIYKSTNTNFTTGRGKILNGGGGGSSHNAGGGGGGNFTAGGSGHPGWNGTANGCASGGGGLGGISLQTHISLNRIFMGGGGGGGHQDDNSGTSGGNGGGIIIIKAKKITFGSPCSNIFIRANGISATNAIGDGGGGGGAGGTIILNAEELDLALACNLYVQANGGNGASVVSPGHGPGGGGAQGAIFLCLPSTPTNLLATTLNGTRGCNFVGNCLNYASNPSGSNNQGVFPSAVCNNLSPLSASVIKLQLELKNNFVHLFWNINDDNKHKGKFYVQKSKNLYTWNDLYEVERNTFSPTRYAYIDTSLIQQGELHYYRILFKGDNSNFFSNIQHININKLQEQTLTVYPNPIKETLYIKTFSKNYHLTLMSIEGEKLFEADNLERLDMRQYKSGLYVLKYIIYDDKNSYGYLKIVKID